MQQETREGQCSPEEEALRDYLARDLAASKIQLNESRRHAGRLLILVILAVLLILCSVVGFSATVYFITKEQTAQIQSIFSANWYLDIEDRRAAEHIYQDANGGCLQNAIINNNASDNTVSVMGAE